VSVPKPGPKAGRAERLAAAAAAGALSASAPIPSPTADTPAGIGLTKFPYPFLDSEEEFLLTKAKWVPVEVPAWVRATEGGVFAFIMGRASATRVATGAAPVH